MADLSTLPGRSTPFTGSPSLIQPVILNQVFHATDTNTLYVADSLTLGDLSPYGGGGGGGGGGQAIEVIYTDLHPLEYPNPPTYGEQNTGGISFLIRSFTEYGTANTQLFYGGDTTGGGLNLGNNSGNGWIAA